ncbi:hypothetical protein HYC85_002368 [Camellia sinensis]|uniref:Uncharacterized protein n=1 Tax=Camellia sinensis TaxID=4442 RepID=A0A7J7I8A8_CAMSI|nr:hypothetical protein HYC85_002368 [Camellia sinensis]
MYVYSVRVCCTIHAYSCHGKLNTHFTPHILSSSALGLAHMTESSSAASVARGGTEPPALTLKEFLDSFSEDENKEVKGVFEAYRRDVRGETGIFKNIKNSELRHSAHLDKVSALICEAVYNMCNTKVVDITTSLLLTWFHSFALAQYANFEIMFVIARLTKLVCAHFGLQADHDVPVYLNLAGLSVQIAKQLAVIDSKALAIVKQDGEADDLRKKVDSMQLTISKLDEAIQELENNKQAIGKKKQALGKKKQKHALEKNKKALLKTREEKSYTFYKKSGQSMKMLSAFQGPLVVTLKEFLDSFTENENEEVQGLSESYRRDVREGAILPKIFPSLYEDVDEDKNKKIRMAVAMEKFISEVEVAMPWENFKDGNDMILKNQVSTLKGLFSKYGDFSNRLKLSTKANTLFMMIIHILEEEWSMHGKVEELRALTSKEFLDSFTEDENKEVDKDEYDKIDMIKVLMKKFVSEVGSHIALGKLGFHIKVCEAVHDMYSTKIGDITTSQLLIWLLSFTLAQYAGFEIQFVIARLTKLVHAHFGLQADDDIPIDLELAKMGVPIATQLSVVDSKELSNIEQDGETDGDLWKKVSLQLTIMKLDEAIEDLKKKKQALLKMQEDRCLRKECLIDVLELERQMAGASLL